MTSKWTEHGVSGSSSIVLTNWLINLRVSCLIELHFFNSIVPYTTAGSQDLCLCVERFMKDRIGAMAARRAATLSTTHISIYFSNPAHWVRQPCSVIFFQVIHQINHFRLTHRRAHGTICFPEYPDWKHDPQAVEKDQVQPANGCQYNTYNVPDDMRVAVWLRE
jgi:hypothetical protein